MVPRFRAQARKRISNEPYEIRSYWSLRVGSAVAVEDLTGDMLD